MDAAEPVGPAEAVVAVAPPLATLELSLAPEFAERLHRLPPMVRLGASRGRRSEIEVIWYDTPGGSLAAGGLALSERRVRRERHWWLERTRGTTEVPWPPGTPAPVVAEAALLAGLGTDIPAPLLPVAACAGTVRTLPLAAAPTLTVTLLDARLRAVAGERPVCRLVLSGPAEPLEQLALALVETAPVAIPPVSLAAEAYAVAGRATPPPALGAPVLPADLTVADAFARVVGHLTFVLLHWAPHAAVGATPEAVHQMRVALRRLRSAIPLFRTAVGGADIEAAGADLRALSGVLGPARDWDVFGAGTARAVAAMFPDDPAVARLLAAADRQRIAAYGALAEHLNGPAFRRLGLRLALLPALRPWERGAAGVEAESMTRDASVRNAPLADFAARALARRLGRLRPPEGDFVELPIEALHTLRIQAKRLRYAAEFFAPLFPRKETRRFLRRIGVLQERLGHLNDGAVAEQLMAQLGRSGGGTASDRAMAVGIVRGFVAAGASRARTKSERSWRKLRRLEPFWE